MMIQTGRWFLNN